MYVSNISNHLKVLGILALLFVIIPHATCIHLKGTWKTDDFFFFLIKFGFQKTDLHNPYSSGYVYGNMTSDNAKLAKFATFVMLDYESFIEYYQRRSPRDKGTACQIMFEKLAVDKCDKQPEAKKTEYITKVPCPKGKRCANPGSEADFVYGSQFSYQVKDQLQPKYVRFFPPFCNPVLTVASYVTPFRVTRRVICAGFGTLRSSPVISTLQRALGITRARS